MSAADITNIESNTSTTNTSNNNNNDNNTNTSDVNINTNNQNGSNTQTNDNNNDTNTNNNNNNNNSNENTSNTDANGNSNQNSNNNSNNTSNNNSNESTPNKKSKSKTKSKSKSKSNSKSKSKSKESDSDEDEVKISGKKDDSGLKTSSSYYHFKSTDPKEAEKFKPKKLDSKDAANASTSSISGASAWNTGATMETFDFSDWVKDQIKFEMVKVSFPLSNDQKGSINITEVDSCDGHATIVFSRGKFRPGFDFTLKLKYSGKYDDKDVEGTITMDDVCMDDDEEDWGYEVSSKKFCFSFFVLFSHLLVVVVQGW